MKICLGCRKIINEEDESPKVCECAQPRWATEKDVVEVLSAFYAQDAGFDEEGEGKKVRVLPFDVSPRVETGALQFKDDWPGLFLRGDTAIWLALQLKVAVGVMRGVNGLAKKLSKPISGEVGIAAHFLESIQENILKNVHTGSWEWDKSKEEAWISRLLPFGVGKDGKPFVFVERKTPFLPHCTGSVKEYNIITGGRVVGTYQDGEEAGLIVLEPREIVLEPCEPELDCTMPLVRKVALIEIPEEPLQRGDLQEVGTILVKGSSRKVFV